MKQCPACGHLNKDDINSIRCPECGSFYSKIIELIEQEAAEEEQQTWRGYCKRIWAADNRRQAIRFEFEQFKAGLTKQGIVAIWIVIVFVFALIVTVL